MGSETDALCLPLGLTCFEEVSLCVALRIIAFIWSEEETHGPHLNHNTA